MYHHSSYNLETGYRLVRWPILIFNPLISYSARSELMNTCRKANAK